MRPTGARRAIAAGAWAASAVIGAPAWGQEHDSSAAENDLLELGCVACHETDIEWLLPAGGRALAPSLTDVGARIRPRWLAEFLRDPGAAQPGTRMPDLLAGLPEDERQGVVEDLVQYLVSLGGPLAEAPVPALAERIEAGRQLFHEVGCVACHAPIEQARHLALPFWDAEELDPDWVAPSPMAALPDLAAKYRLQPLAELLLDPLALRPYGRMPSLHLSAREARDVALYLCALPIVAGEGDESVLPGLAFEAYEGDFGDDMPDFAALEVVRRGVIDDLDALPEHRPEEFAFVFRGLLQVSEPGMHELAIESDDGSRLWLDGELLIDNDGDHAMLRKARELHLEVGRHALRLEYFQNKGGLGLSLTWSGPGFEEREIEAGSLGHLAFVLGPPESAELELDPAAVERGRRHFDRLACDACHADGRPAADRPPRARSLADLARGAPGGCLTAKPVAGLPRYGLSDERRARLARGLARLPEAGVLPPHVELERRLSSLGCSACHARAGAGGPATELRPYFRARAGAELGDEGRIPPHLDRAGAKLRPAWLSAVLLEGAVARPHLATRMPDFGAANVAGLVELFTAVDLPAAGEKAPEPEFHLADVEAGRALCGTRGLGCIQCHDLAGRASLGIRAVDLADVAGRLTWDWFRKLLADPASINMNTRMPKFWSQGASPVADVLGGDPERQIEALWTYLSLGAAMSLPHGLVSEPGAHELVVLDEPRLVGVFMAGVGPRTLAVGFPENLHYAFDVSGSRLARAWRGRFFDASGTWVGRAGQLELPPSSDVIDLAPGVPFAILAVDEDPWPPARDGAEAGYRVLGRGFDSKRRPVFRYRLGPATIEETPQPRLGPGGASLLRRFRVSADRELDRLWMRVAVGERIVTVEPSLFEVDGRARVRVGSPAEPRLRRREEGFELLARVAEWRRAGDGCEAYLEVELGW